MFNHMTTVHGNRQQLGSAFADGLDYETQEDLPSARELVPLNHQLLPPSIASAFGIFLQPSEPLPAGSGLLPPGLTTSEDAPRQNSAAKPSAGGGFVGGAATTDPAPSTSYVSSERDADPQHQQQQQQQQQQNAQLQNLLAASYQFFQGQGLAGSMQQSNPLPSGPGPPGLAAQFSNNAMQGVLNQFTAQQPQMPYMGFDPSGQQMHPGAYMTMHPAAMGFSTGMMPGQPGMHSQHRQHHPQEDSEEDQTRAVKRPRLVWTDKLHRKFEEVVQRLGVDKAMPKSIMQAMNVEGLTRENVASHLQKYRISLKKQSEAAARRQAEAGQEHCSNSGVGSPSGGHVEPSGATSKGGQAQQAG